MMDGAGSTESHRGSNGSLAEVGTMLRDRRVELGHDIETVARQTHIKVSYLKAIEEGRRRDLPGAAYTIGFVRTYADFLGFDGNRVVTDFHAQLAGARSRAPGGQAAQPAPELPRFTISPVMIAGAALVLALVGFFLWGYLSDNSGDSDSASVEEAQDSAEGEEAPIDQQGVDQEGADQQAGAAGDAEAPAAATPPADSATAAETATPGATPDAAAAAPAPVEDQLPPPEVEASELAEQDPEQAQVATAAAGAAGKVVLRAKLESWVQITNEKNEAVFSRVLRAGETYTVPNETGLRLTTGNAGGVEIMLDGKKLKSLGSVGLVRRDFPLDAKKLKDGSAFKPATSAPATP
jgi:cytoskeleton protein RodZ